MKTVYLTVIMMVIVLAFAVAAYAANYCCPDRDTGNPCLSCRAPAWDNRPVTVTAPCSSGPGYTVEYVPRQKLCGAYCDAGQVASGWPYGWRSEYWLRPDSNF